jgi:hypothetical protein
MREFAACLVGFGAICSLAGCAATQSGYQTVAHDAGADASAEVDLAPQSQADLATPVASSIILTPPDQTFTLTIGTTQTITYQATAVYPDGTQAPATGTFSLIDSAIGSIDPISGTFTANGVIGGQTQVQFVADDGAMGSTSLTVNLAAAIIPNGASPSPDGLFAVAGTPVIDATAQANIVYPLDQVVFPQNISAPLVQWQIGDGSGSGGAADWYRITYSKPHITIIQYAQNALGFNFAAAVADTVFSRLAETDPYLRATLVIDRLDVTGNRIVGGAPIHLYFARGSISGTVYYWAMDQARLHRIPAGTVDNQMMFPPNIVGTATTQPGYSYGGCIACHQISRDGRYLAANGDQAYLFDLTAADPTMSNMPVATHAGFRWYFSSISPDNSRIFATMPDASFAYTDLTVQQITPTGTVPTTGVAHPSWSPDGKTVAYISNVTGWTSIASFTGGDLTLVDVNAASDVFSGLRVIHSGSSLAASDPAGGNADCFPTWTPDAKFLLFAHTANTRGTGATRYDGSLYMMPPTAGATPVRLATASDSAGHPQSHYPNTSPFISGGYYWIVFYSTRDYGNALAGTRGTARPQLWVSAISTKFDGSTDPSSVPYWLPGQSTTNQNADAVWAASPCRMSGSSCLTSSDCCSGACQPVTDGGYVCTTPQMCRREGESCEHDSDCCGMGALVCDPVIHTCQSSLGPPP